MKIKILFWITLFSIAMGYLESSVVVYLRDILDNDAFTFPIKPLPEKIAITEIFREAATLIMLLGVAIITGKTKTEKFAWFIYSFAVWDIFYYVFLKILLDWPESLLTWDILFLIPAIWTGPVITPLIIALTMIILALIILWYSNKKEVIIIFREWALLITGSLVVILAFIWDSSKFILKYYSIGQIFIMQNKKPVYELAMQYIPDSFTWLLFSLGEVIIISGIYFIVKRLSMK